MTSLIRQCLNVYRNRQIPQVFRNGLWGAGGNIAQLVFASAFFIIAARKLSILDMGNFLVATAIYQLVVAFSSMGLGQWFIREFGNQRDRMFFTAKFLKVQLMLGIVFYLLTVAAAVSFYPAGHIQSLILILGLNIIFDNLIYALKSLNIAESNQRSTAVILFVDGFLKLAVALVLLIYPMGVLSLALVLILVRLFTAGYFLRIGAGSNVNLSSVAKVKVSMYDIRSQVISNWQFIIIGSISIIFWRMGNIVVSHFLSSKDVTDYEISFRIFSLFLMFPIVATTTIYPWFIKSYKAKSQSMFSSLYHELLIYFTAFSFLSFAFVYFFADHFVPFIFGTRFADASVSVREMFLSFLFFPTILLQANLIVAMKLERVDMWLNITSLLVNLIGCLLGFYIAESLSVVNFSILFSIIVFHILQNVILVRKKVLSFRSVAIYYLSIFSFVIVSWIMLNYTNPYLAFVIMLVLILSVVIWRLKTRRTKGLQLQMGIGRLREVPD